MKRIAQNIIQKRNPKFEFDPQISSWMIFEMCFGKFIALLRSLKLLPRGKFAGLLFLGKGVRFEQVSKMEFGKWVKIGDYSKLAALGKGKLIIGDKSGIGAFSNVIVSTSFNNIGEHIHIGKNVGIGEYAYLGGGGGLEIGDDCIVGQYFSCHPENHNYQDLNIPIRLQGVNRKGIKIGANCWIGSKVTILDGVEVGDSCVIAAGAVVTKNMPSNSVIGGVPARVLKRRDPKVSAEKNDLEKVLQVQEI